MNASIIGPDRLQIKLFSDGADLVDMQRLANLPYIKGLTTNPTLMTQAGINNYENFAKEVLLFLKEKPISFEVFSDEFDDMERQAHKIAGWGENIYVKIPVTNTKGFSSSTLIKRLALNGIKLNITAVYTAKQTKRILKLINKKSKVIVSIFAGRAGDTGKDPIPEIKKSIALSKKFKNVEILWASVREPYNYIQAKQLDCHIITVPPSIIEKIESFGKSFDQLTKETVKTFLIDSKKSKFKI